MADSFPIEVFTTCVQYIRWLTTQCPSLVTLSTCWHQDFTPKMSFSININTNLGLDKCLQMRFQWTQTKTQKQKKTCHREASYRPQRHGILLSHECIHIHLFAKERHFQLHFRAKIKSFRIYFPSKQPWQG